MLLKEPKLLANACSRLTPDKKTYADIKEKLIQHSQSMFSNWNTDYYKREEKVLDAISLAAYYYFNHNLSYGPMYLGWISKIYHDEKKWKKMVDKIANFKCENLEVRCDSFENSIQRHSNDFLYLDPPYYLEEGTVFKGMYPNGNFPIHHKGFDHGKLRDLLHSHNNGFLLSYNDCPTIREWYKEFEIIDVNWHYSYALGETRSKTQKTKSSEILIRRK